MTLHLIAVGIVLYGWCHETNFIFIVFLIMVMTVGAKCAYAELQTQFLLPSSVRVEIVEAYFHRDDFKISGCATNGDICLINGQVPFGTDYEPPKTYLKNITVSYKQQSYSLDVSNMYNAWGNRPLDVKGIRYFGGKCYDNRNCQFRGLFSDAAGAFVAEWRIVDGIEFRTVLTNSSDVMKLFMMNIDPPEYE